MVKFKKDKLKQIKKIASKLQASPTNKILKKKLNLEKKVTFHKETLLKQNLKSDHIVKNVKPKSSVPKKIPTKQEKSEKSEHKTNKPKQKSVEKKKKRQKTQVYDTKLILSLMKQKFNENEDGIDKQ